MSLIYVYNLNQSFSTGVLFTKIFPGIILNENPSQVC